MHKDRKKVAPKTKQNPEISFKKVIWMHLRFSLENQTLMLRSDKSIQEFLTRKKKKKKHRKWKSATTFGV